MKYASIDIETTGLDPDRCQILEIGIVLDDLSKQEPVEDLPSFQCYLRRDEFVGEPIALAMNAAIFKRIADLAPGYNYTYADSVYHQVEDWLISKGAYAHGDKLLCAGKNFASFDSQFLRRLPRWCVKFHHRSIDPAMWFMDGSPKPPSLQECCDRAGLGKRVTHGAVEDARLVIELVRLGFNRQLWLAKLGACLAKDSAVDPGFYEHFKGGKMLVHGTAMHTEDKQDLVVYEHDGKMWARPLDSFTSEVEPGKRRFTRA